MNVSDTTVSYKTKICTVPFWGMLRSAGWPTALNSAAYYLCEATSIAKLDIVGRQGRYAAKWCRGVKDPEKDGMGCCMMQADYVGEDTMIVEKLDDKLIWINMRIVSMIIVIEHDKSFNMTRSNNE